jgi:hypothetical protein
MTDDLYDRFRHHPPTTKQQQATHEYVRELCGDVARQMDGMLPSSREKAIVLTKLEEVMFWANAALARHRPAS